MKGGVEVLWRFMAKELGPRKIAVNVIAPGAIETDFGGGAVRDNKEMNRMIASSTALGRVGLPDDVGGAVAALLSDDSQWVNGQDRSRRRYIPLRKKCRIRAMKCHIGRLSVLFLLAAACSFAQDGITIRVNAAETVGPYQTHLRLFRLRRAQFHVLELREKTDRRIGRAERRRRSISARTSCWRPATERPA